MDKYTATEQAFKHGYEKGYEAGKPKWIPVSERLPENGKEVLCLRKGGYLWLAMWNSCGDRLWSDSEYWYGETAVTHWMPLPEPPKEGE